MKYIEPETLDVFLQLNESPIVSFQIAGIEFTDDPNQVLVSVKVRGPIVATLGEAERTVQETWVWKEGQWLMRATPPPTIFDSQKIAPGPLRPDFQVTESLIDAGKHNQGDIVEGKITFKAPRRDIRVIRPLGNIPGLAIGTPVWTDATGGYISYRWETALVSQNLDRTIPLEATATSDGRTSVDLRFRVQVAGKVGFRQIPEIINPISDGQVTLEIQNLLPRPLKILSVMSYNAFYVVDDNVPESIEPGRTGRLLIRYRAQTRGSAASIGLVLSESLTPSGILAVPLNVKLPEPDRPAPYTPETLKPFLPGQPPVVPQR